MASEDETLRFDDRMSDLESLMWRLEQIEPSLLSTMTLVAVFDRPLNRDRFEEKVELLTRRVPRLRDRVDAGPLPMVPPTWRPDPDFSIDQHLSWRTVGSSGDSESLLLVAEADVVSAFDAERPPWHLTVVDGLEGGREALIARLHHSYTDGQGAVRIAMELFDLEADAPVVGIMPELPPPPMLPLLGRTVADVIHEASRTASVVRSIGPWLAGSLRSVLVADPERVSAPARALIRSVGELAVEAMTPGSSLLAPRGAGIRLAELRMDLEGMRRAARSGGGKINDVFLAGMLGGLSRYHDKHGDRSRSVRMGIPISTRSDGTVMRNQLQGILMHGPLDIAEPLDRVKIVHDMVLHTRGQPWLDFIDAGAGAALRLPAANGLLASAVRSTDALASNLPGPPVPVFMAGAAVERLVPFGPRSGAALNLTLLSYRGDVSVGVNCDPAAIPDVDVLLDCLHAGFGEVLALA